MVAKKTHKNPGSYKSPNKKEVKASKKAKKVEESEEEGGTSLDDAFGDDDGVEYAESKPRKEKKNHKTPGSHNSPADDGEADEGVDEEEIESEIGAIEKTNGDTDSEIQINASKPVQKVKKGDKVKVDGKEYEVDSHYVLIDHKTTKEMAIELFDPKTDKDYQIRYFDDQVERTIEFYELQEIMFLKRPVKKIEW